MNTAAVQKSWEGRVIDGRFPLLQWLGGSEHSAVFLTELRGQESRKAAIKLIPADAGTVETRISRWEITMGLSHPHLIRLYHTGQCEINATPLLYVVMEYAEEDLSQILPLRPLTGAEIGEMLPPVVDALSYIHEKRLVHGHLKPSNIMVVDNRLKLSSDGIQAPDELGTSGLEPRMSDAPEHTASAALPAADVWSLGVTLVTALTQHPPVWEETGPGEPIVPDSIPEPFRAIARECLRRDPGERCTLEHIKALLQSPSAPLRRVEKPAAMVRPMRRVVAPIVAGLIALAVFAGVRLVTHRTPTRTTDAEEHPDASTAPRPSPTRAPKATAKTAKGATARGAVVERVLPDVPKNARNTIRGTVRVDVRVSVSPAGKVLAATLESPGPSRYFASLALQAARGWKFQAPQVDRKSVVSEWILRFQFGRTETQVVPVEVAP